MNFALFSVETTNIFPIANSVNGGQLVTEFNLKSRESVLTDPSVQYIIGPSYTHGTGDFFVSSSSNASEYFTEDASLSSTVLEIQPGRAVVNGHYIENLAPMVIDLAEVNAQLLADGQEQLSGDLSIGLKVMYSTETTMSGSIMGEASSDIGEVYAGIQIVLLPTSQFLTPTSHTKDGMIDIYCGDLANRGLVTADLLLATFSFINGNVTNVVQNPNKLQMLSAERIDKINEALSSDFVKKTGLNPDKLYVFAGKGEDPETGFDTWCEAEDSLIVWDKTPQMSTTKPEIEQAQFVTANGKTALVLPHKQIDNDSSSYTTVNANGKPVYYQPRVMQLPLADYNTETAGTVNAEYTRQVKQVASKISDLYNLTNGKQRGFVDVLTDKADLPAINPNWNIGDYILVSQDQSVEYDGLNSGSRAPSTIYVLLPPPVIGIRYYGDSIGTLSGQCLATVIKSAADGDEAPDIEHFNVYSSYWGDLETKMYRGQVNVDYFTYVYTDENNVTTTYYYRVAAVNSEELEYSDQVYITRPIPFASQGSVGGFIDIDPTLTDEGYVYLDSNGHLRLLDYQLLRSGTLAYQLGEDFTVPSGLTISEIQAYLDEYVNQRVAFPNINQVQNAAIPNDIKITITITGDEEGGTLNIYDIDSRFDTSVTLNILGTAGTNVTINISDCERVRIGANHYIEGTPVINVYRSCVYYDPETINMISTVRDLKLWYTKFTTGDPDIYVEGMTVSAIATNSSADSNGGADIGYWSTSNPNDNHFAVMLKDITLDGSGSVVKCGVLVRNGTTANVVVGTHVTHLTNFELPQGDTNGLRYPAAKMNKHVKVTGEFITSYISYASPKGYVIQNTQFSLWTPIYDAGQNITSAGEISFLVTAYTIADDSPQTIDVWNSDSFHYFTGSTLD